MTIAELFVKLGVTGGDKVKKELTGVKEGLGNIVSASLAAKAGLAAMVYGLERMTGWASQAGMDLKSFNTLTGLSTERLQEWQHAGMLYGATADDMAAGITSIQDAMTSLALGQGAPAGFAQMMQDTGMDPERLHDTFYVLSKIQQFIKNAPAPMAKKFAKEIGLSDNVITALKQINILKDKASKKDILNRSEIDRLTDINRQWKEFWFQLETMGKKTIASEGFKEFFDNVHKDFAGVTSMVKGINELTNGFAGVATAAAIAGRAILAAFGPPGLVIAGIIEMMHQIDRLKRGESLMYGLVPKEWSEKIRDTINGSHSSTGMRALVEKSQRERALREYQDKKVVENNATITLYNTFEGKPEENASSVQQQLQRAFGVSNASIYNKVPVTQGGTQ